MGNQYPLADDFNTYLKDNGFGKRNISNILSRINTLIENGYTSRIDNKHIDIIDKQLRDCLNELPSIIKSTKNNHNLALQILAAVFASLDDVIQKNPNNRALCDIRSAFIHYYLFVENQLSLQKKAKKGVQVNIPKIQQALNKFYGSVTKIHCFTQKEVRENFIQRLHSQDRLYNHNLLFPISLIVKLFGKEQIVKGWTNNAIDDIEIIISSDKNKMIHFKDVSFFVFRGSKVYVFDRNKGKEYTVFTRKYRIIEEEDAYELEVHDFGQPLQSFSIDHKTSMAELLNTHSSKKDVPHLQALSNDFCQDIIANGKLYLKNNKWLLNHNFAQGLDMLNVKTINDLSTGYKNNSKRKKIDLKDLIHDIIELHKSGIISKDGLELMDYIQNGIKRDF